MVDGRSGFSGADRWVVDVQMQADCFPWSRGACRPVYNHSVDGERFPPLHTRYYHSMYMKERGSDKIAVAGRRAEDDLQRNVSYIKGEWGNEQWTSPPEFSAPHALCGTKSSYLIDANWQSRWIGSRRAESSEATTGSPPGRGPSAHRTRRQRNHIIVLLSTHCTDHDLYWRLL